MSTENGKISNQFRAKSTTAPIKKEPILMNGMDSLRLSSFSSPRDLTLGGRGGCSSKKVFTPNLNVVRNKNSNVKTSKDTTSRGRGRTDRSKSERGGRGRGGRGGTLVQTTGVFSEGAGAVNIRRSVGSSSSSSSYGRSDDAVSNMRKPMLVKRENAKIDIHADAAHIREIIGDSEDDDFGCDEKTDLDHIPIKLSIEKWKTFKKEKIEPLSEVKMETDDKSDLKLAFKPKSQTLQSDHVQGDISNFLRYPEYVDELFRLPQSQLFLMQLPDTLPCEEDDSDASLLTPASTSKEAYSKAKETSESVPTATSSKQKSTNFFSIKQLEEGQIGKLLRYKSGKCKLVLGESYFDLDIGMETGFIQDVVSISTNREERNGDMINLGPIEAKVTATPDWEYLLKHQ